MDPDDYERTFTFWFRIIVPLAVIGSLAGLGLLIWGGITLVNWVVTK